MRGAGHIVSPRAQLVIIIPVMQFFTAAELFVTVTAEKQVRDVSGSESHSNDVIEQSSDASASDTEPLPTAAYEQMPTEATGIETAHEQILTATEGINKCVRMCMQI